MLPANHPKKELANKKTKKACQDTPNKSLKQIVQEVIFHIFFGFWGHPGGILEKTFQNVANLEAHDRPSGGSCSTLFAEMQTFFRCFFFPCFSGTVIFDRGQTGFGHPWPNDQNQTTFTKTPYRGYQPYCWCLKRLQVSSPPPIPNESHHGVAVLALTVDK